MRLYAFREAHIIIKRATRFYEQTLISRKTITQRKVAPSIFIYIKQRLRPPKFYDLRGRKIACPPYTPPDASSLMHKTYLIIIRKMVSHVLIYFLCCCRYCHSKGMKFLYCVP